MMMILYPIAFFKIPFHTLLASGLFALAACAIKIISLGFSFISLASFIQVSSDGIDFPCLNSNMAPGVRFSSFPRL